MALWVCSGEEGCGTRYAVGLFRCPRCHNTAFYEDGDPMAKISRHGGATDHTVPAPEAEVEAPAPEPVDVTEHLAPSEPVAKGGEESSPGSSSSASTEKPETSSEPSKLPRRKPARMTASRSKQGQTETSSAPSTDGDPTEATSDSSDSSSD